MKPRKYHPHALNESIQAKTILVLDANRSPIGELPLQEALRQARVQGQDLILIAPKANPPVCLMADYGRFLFEQSKREPHHRTTRQKEIQLSANIFEHDLDIKARQAREFLEHGHSVRVILKLRGREKAHPQIGQQQMDRFLAKLDGVAAASRRSQSNGSAFVTTIQPNHT